MGTDRFPHGPPIQALETPNPRSWRLRSARISAVFITALVLAAAANAVDPFYMRLLRQGTDSYNRRDYAPAVRQLRVACFGLLDDPQVLADGLTRLALAQAASGDPTGFRETFQRITEVEERFQGYSRADIPPDVRAGFEALVIQGIPAATLVENPAFSRLVPTREQRVASLPPSERRKELNRLVKAEPRQVTWRLMLGQLDLAEGDVRGAWQNADAGLKIAPGSEEALRVRGLGFAGDKRWSQAVDDLRACGGVTSDRRVAAALLGSLVELKRWQEASAYVAQLPPALATDPAIRDLEERAGNGLKAATPALTPTPARTHTPTPAPTAAPTRTPTPATTAAAVRTPTPVATVAPTRTPTPVATAVPTRAPAPAPTATQPVPTAVRTVQGAGPPPPAAATLAPVGVGAVAAADTKPTTAPSLPSVQAELDRVRELARTNKLEDACAAARRVADAHPESPEAQHLAGEMAYRTSRWPDAVLYFRRWGEPPDARPVLLFYYAVALYETGDRAGAATALRRSLPNIRRTEYVELYVTKILGTAASPTQTP
jgi:tetratricopeptide (TPR) repeat protein